MSHHIYYSSDSVRRECEALDGSLTWHVVLTVSQYRQDAPLRVDAQIAGFEREVDGHSPMVAFALLDGFGGDLAPIREQLAADRACKCVRCKCYTKTEGATT